MFLLLIISSCTYGGLTVDLLDQKTEGKVCLKWSFYGATTKYTHGVYEADIPKKSDSLYLMQSNFRRKYNGEFINCVRQFIVFGHNGKLTENILEYVDDSVKLRPSGRGIISVSECWFTQLPKFLVSEAYHTNVLPEKIGRDILTANLIMKSTNAEYRYDVLAVILQKRPVHKGSYQ